ncbi:transferase [Streptomyces anthocyanicus]|nr:ADP-heptose:LPS heptosyltransferase [Streptomyces sp. 2221.1]GHC04471.1 transferase [Streptomyces anthocyanicus]SDT78130.1 ADP-heptose:LPS heptosyltransferase [Streptomyces sp. 2114.2]
MRPAAPARPPAGAAPVRPLVGAAAVRPLAAGTEPGTQPPAVVVSHPTDPPPPTHALRAPGPGPQPSRHGARPTSATAYDRPPAGPGGPARATRMTGPASGVRPSAVLRGHTNGAGTVASPAGPVHKAPVRAARGGIVGAGRRGGDRAVVGQGQGARAVRAARGATPARPADARDVSAGGRVAGSGAATPLSQPGEGRSGFPGSAGGPVTGDPVHPPVAATVRRGGAGTVREGPDPVGSGEGGGVPRVLVLRALGLGDLLAAVPALRALRRAYPGHELVLAAPAELAPVAAATGAVDRVLPAAAPGRAVPHALDWTGPPPDVAVDLHGNGPPSHRLLSRLGPRRLLAFAHPGTPEVDGPPWYAEEHERERWCRLLRGYGIDADARDLRLPRPDAPSPAPGAVVLHPGAGAPARCWPVERYAVVAEALRARGRRVVVTGGADEADLVARLAKRAGLPDTDVFGGGLPYGRLSALVADARAVVSGDTGIAHLAVAHATPSVTLFGPVPPSRWGPPPDPRHRALWHPGPDGDPHGRRTDPALLRITPDAVLDACDALDALDTPDAPDAPEEGP